MSSTTTTTFYEKATAPVPEAPYTFPLGEESRRVAAAELRETGDDIANHGIAFLRDWLQRNPKILKCRHDNSFLLRFLRAKKYSLPTVQVTLERYLMLRECYMDQVFQRVRLAEEPSVADLLDRGFVFPLPQKDALRRRVLVIRPRVFDFERHTMRDLIRLFTVLTDVLIEDEENQVHGFCYIIDAVGASMQLLTLATPAVIVRLLRNGEALVPMRHGLVVGYKVPAGFKVAIDFAMGFVSEKLRRRVRQVSDLTTTCPEIPREILPKELGGEALTIDQMIGLWRQEMQSQQCVWDLVEQNNAMRVNLGMFTEKEMAGAFGRSQGPAEQNAHGVEAGVSGSFRQLKVD